MGRSDNYGQTRLERLNKRQWKLVTDNLGFAPFYARKVWLRHNKAPDLDDLISCCFLGMIRAAEGYNPKRNVKFISFAWYHMSRQCQTHIGRFSQQVHKPANGHRVKLRHIPDPRCFSIDSFPQEDSLDFLGHVDPKEVTDQLADESFVAILMSALSRCPNGKRKREVLIRRANGETLKEIGISFGLSRERIRQLESAAKEDCQRIAEQIAQGGSDVESQKETCAI